MATRQREKAAKRRESADKRPHATARYIRISSSKVRIVIDLVRGKQVDEALTILRFTPKAASPVVEKLLNSAIANAENNLEMSRDELYVADIRADQGPTLKRFRPRSRGMANPILKRTSHISVILDRKAAKEEA
ncbi:MAG: 50S ribosomal protein L22 [Eubacteriales bacterium]|nr:50S ribosomal protein L22 [Eubacteriales bacterium]